LPADLGKKLAGRESDRAMPDGKSRTGIRWGSWYPMNDKTGMPGKGPTMQSLGAF